MTIVAAPADEGDAAGRISEKMVVTPSPPHVEDDLEKRRVTDATTGMTASQDFRPSTWTDDGTGSGTNDAKENISACCSSMRFGGEKIAQGYNVLGLGRGVLIISNIFLATALTFLASEQVGCVTTDEETGEQIVEEDCNEKVYGLFQPAALITNLAVIWGVLSALFMPVIGALVDYSPYRKRVGMGSAAFLILIQAVQIGINSNTWFYMALLQAASGFLYQVQGLATYAYLPNLARSVGEETMTSYMASFTMVQFSNQLLFLLMATAISLALGFDDVETARLSQCFNVVIGSTCFYLGWKLLPWVPAKHELPEGKWMLTQGFVQNWNTAKEINRTYKRGLRFFLLSVVFGEAAANAFTLVSVVFLDEQLGLSGSEVGVFFVLALVGMVPGTKVAGVMASKTNPKTSWRISMIALFTVTTVGALSLNRDNAFPFSYVWGFAVGILLGWFYPTEGMILSMCIPQGKEAELSGFFVYCTQILGWLPPLVFSLLVEANVDKGIGVMCISSFLLISFSTMSMTAPWDEILEEVARGETGADDNNGVDAVVLNSEKEPAAKQSADELTKGNV